MRSIQVINVRWFNATAWYALFLGKLLQENGHPVLILALPGTAPFQQAQKWGLQVRGLPLNTKNPLNILALFFQMRKIVHAFQPDVVNCHRGESFFLWPLVRTTSRPFALIRTRGDQRLPKSNAVNRFLHKRLCQAVITTNSRMRNHFALRFALDSEKLHLIPGGVDRQSFFPSSQGRARVRDKFGFTASDFVLGLVGRLDTVKGQRELIRTVARLYHHHGLQELRLLLIGFSSAISEDTVRGWIEEENIRGICRITGRVNRPAEYISALDLGIINSGWSEAIARAALEIMACRVPLISTSVGVMPDLLPPEALFPPDDSAALAESILCFRDPEKRRQILKKESRHLNGLGAKDFLRRTLEVYTRATNQQVR
ncbi:MAG: glycosyltransferase family 4 protein [Desulfonatronovibrionaceae bacterium]